MLESEFLQTEVATAFNSLMKLSSDFLGLTFAVYRAFEVVGSVDTADWQLFNSLLGFAAPMVYDQAKVHREQSHATLHVMTLLASWGVFEAFIEDVCKGMVSIELELLDAAEFDAGRRRADRRSVDAFELTEFIVDFTLSNQRSRLDADGNGKYEEQLALVRLSGTIPRDLAIALMSSQQIRNVWAHNQGRADKRLVEQCPNLSYQIGEEVSVTPEICLEYITALNTYAYIVLNRFRIQFGLPAIQCYTGEQNKFTSSFDELFPDAIEPLSLKQRLDSEQTTGS
jgi:hypothetical protein